MATITRYLSTIKNHDGQCEIYMRVSVSRTARFKVHSGLFVDPARFANGSFKKPRIMNAECQAILETERRLDEIDARIFKYLSENPDPKKDDIDRIVHDCVRPKRQYKKREKCPKTPDFFTLFDKFIKSKGNLTAHWIGQYMSLERALHRFEKWTQATSTKRFKLSPESFDPDAFTQFYRDEPRIYEQFAEIYKEYPVELRAQRLTHKPQQRGDNMIADIAKKLSAFFNWCVKEGMLQQSPMARYKGVKEERYGTPVYLTKEERDKVALFDLSSRPQLAKQRDVFIFQCHVGCRVGDLYSFDRTNIVGDALEYIPGKTRKDRLDTIRVPLTSTARAILDRYKGDATMLPLISQQKYNIAIKEVLRVCGIDRVVTVINPTTGEDERKPIWEVASSHMARRTFVGNLYKKVKDPNLVGALSGHKEGSRAFVRYRDIDDDIRRETMNLLE